MTEMPINREMTKNAHFFRRLNWAWQGIQAAWKQENSFRTQAKVAFGVILSLCFIQPGWIWGALIFITIGLVLVAELINTALETTLDGLHASQAPFVKLAKDCAAGAALVASIVAVLVGIGMMLDVFGPMLGN
jgi:undecaprenol kinase